MRRRLLPYFWQKLFHQNLNRPMKISTNNKMTADVLFDVDKSRFSRYSLKYYWEFATQCACVAANSTCLWQLLKTTCHQVKDQSSGQRSTTGLDRPLRLCVKRWLFNCKAKRTTVLYLKSSHFGTLFLETIVYFIQGMVPI